MERWRKPFFSHPIPSSSDVYARRQVHTVDDGRMAKSNRYFRKADKHGYTLITRH